MAATDAAPSAVTGGSQPTEDAELVARLAIERRVLTARQLEECAKLAATVEERFGIGLTLGQVVLERVFATNPGTRPVLVRRDGVREILGPGVKVDFLKLSKVSHDRLMERVERAALVRADRLEDCRRIQRELAGLGIVMRLGEILAKKGYIERGLVEECIAPPRDLYTLLAFAFARIAIHNGLLDEQDAADALELSAQIAEETGLHLPVGRLLYEMGFLRRREVEAILVAQVEMGRLKAEDAELRILKLSGAEEGAFLARLARERALSAGVVESARRKSDRLREFGLAIQVVEILWLEDALSRQALQPLLDFQQQALARTDPELPRLSLSVGPSAEELARLRPRDLSESDYLFGQFALVAGAVNREELDRALHVLRRCQKEFGPRSLDRVLFDTYRADVHRLRRLEEARRELAHFLGTSYEPSVVPLSPIEREIVREEIDRADAWPPEGVKRAITMSWFLAELGTVKPAEEILVEEDALSGGARGRELIERRKEENRRICGSAGRRIRPGQGSDKALLERAFLYANSSAGWGSNSLGTLAVEKGLLTRDQVVEALYLQLKTREIGIVKPFGEILVERGMILPAALAELLREQEGRLKRGSEAAPAPAGGLEPQDDLLVRAIRATGALREERLVQALRIRDQLVGLGLRGTLKEILVRRGFLEPEVVAGLLERSGEGSARPAKTGPRRRGDQITTAFQIQEAYERTGAPRPAPSAPVQAPTSQPRPGRTTPWSTIAFVLLALVLLLLGMRLAGF